MTVKVQHKEFNRIHVYNIEAGTYHIEVNGQAGAEVYKHFHTLDSLMKQTWCEVIYFDAGGTYKERCKGDE